MDILKCCRRKLNHELEDNHEQGLEVPLQDLDQEQSEKDAIAKQSHEFFNAIQKMDKERIQSLHDEGFQMNLAKANPSEKKAFHFLAEIEDDAIGSKEDFQNIFQILLDAGCQINATDRYGNTPLMLASEKGNSSALKLLLAKGADPNKNNKDEENGPLHWASKKGKIEAISLLLLYKANVNAQNKRRQTPLHLAVEEDRKIAARRLIAGGADMSLKDLNNKTPLQYARDKSMENLFDNSNSLGKVEKKETSTNKSNDIDESADSKKYHEEYLALYEGIDLAKVDASNAAKVLSQNLKQEKNSMKNPPKDAVKKCRYFCGQFRGIGRKDIIEELRKHVPAGMTGPLAYDGHTSVSEMDRVARRELTRSLCGQEKWKLLADKLGISSTEFDYYDRKPDPAEAVLEDVCLRRDLTVGKLYDALVECNADGLADQYL